MKEYRRNLMVGAFMVVSLAALGVLMVMFGEAPEWLGGAEWELEVQVTQLRGASEGMPVNLNGVQIGRVGKLRFESAERPDLGVSIIALIKDDYFVPAGARAVIYKADLGIGRGRIEIVVPPGGGGDPLPREDAFIRGEQGSMFNEIISETMMATIEKTVLQIGNFAGALTPVAEDLHDMFERTPIDWVDDPAHADKFTANLSTVVQRADRTLKHVNDVLGDPEVKGQLRESVANFHRMTEDGRAALADIRETTETLRDGSERIATKFEKGIDDTMVHVNAIGSRAVPVLDNVASATANLNRVSADLADGEGTAGRFLRDDRLYEKMVLLMERMTAAVETIGRIANKAERQGYIDIAAHKELPGVAVPAKVELYAPGSPAAGN